VSCW